MTKVVFRSENRREWRPAGMVLMLLVLMMAGIALAAETGDVEQGKSIFRESCRHCHGLAGKGDGEMAEYLDPPPANLADPKTQSKSDEELTDVILHGRPGTSMVGLEGALDDTQLADLLAYIRSFKP
jgi:mono/diheme cytochrome c family protein